MSAPVDVLAVMDEAIVSMGMFKLGPDKLREARAAVAELVEAASAVQQDLPHTTTAGPTEMVRRVLRFRSALARIGGAE